MNGYLTGTTATRLPPKKDKTEDTILIEQSPWDALQRDPVDILRMITFHEKSDGTPYTGLANDGLRRLELSPLLDLNRAILFGRLERPAGSLLVGASDATSLEAVPQTRTVTIVRLVLPVMQTGTVLNDLPDYNPNPIKRTEMPKFVPDGDAPAEAEIPSSDTSAPEQPKP